MRTAGKNRAEREGARKERGGRGRGGGDLAGGGVLTATVEQDAAGRHSQRQTLLGEHYRECAGVDAACEQPCSSPPLLLTSSVAGHILHLSGRRTLLLALPSSGERWGQQRLIMRLFAGARGTHKHVSRTE
eukprot:318133-Hanusia_phi.AAC.2